MKTVENKVTEIGIVDTNNSPVLNTDGTTKKMTYADLIRTVVNTMTERMDTVEMKKRFRILDIVDDTKLNGSLHDLQIEDADFDYLKTFIPATGNTFKWSFMSRDLPIFEDYIRAGGKTLEESLKEDKQ